MFALVSARGFCLPVSAATGGVSSGISGADFAGFPLADDLSSDGAGFPSVVGASATATALGLNDGISSAFFFPLSGFGAGRGAGGTLSAASLIVMRFFAVCLGIFTELSGLSVSDTFDVLGAG